MLLALGLLALAYGVAATWAYGRTDLSRSKYPHPLAATADIERLAEQHPDICDKEIIGSSTEGRAIVALRLHGRRSVESAKRPALLITAQIHAIEYVGSYVARAVARLLVENHGKRQDVTDLLDRADIWVVPLLNPDGAIRVWNRGGWTLMGGSRFTARGVDPNRNFPMVDVAGRRSWNSGRDRPGSAYFRGPHPLSEPECLALAQLCARERFCAAVNFHSFSTVVFMPALDDFPASPDRDKAQAALGVFCGPFQERQRHRRYRPIPERSAAIVGQLDSFLLNAFGTVSVTIEVSRPNWTILAPARLFRFFDWANPADPDFWVENDAEATIDALFKLLQATNGSPCQPFHPELGAKLVD